MCRQEGVVAGGQAHESACGGEVVRSCLFGVGWARRGRRSDRPGRVSMEKAIGGEDVRTGILEELWFFVWCEEDVRFEA
jgi:hypothetical protein